MVDNGLYGKCGRCGHVFLVARLPMLIETVVELAKRAACVECGATDGIQVAPDIGCTSASPSEVKPV